LRIAKKKAIEEGRKQYADYSVIAKAIVRQGNAYMKMKDYGKAVEAFGKALTEHRTADTLNLLKKAEKLKAEADVQAYLDPQKAAEAKDRGNQFFKTRSILKQSKSIQRLLQEVLMTTLCTATELLLTQS